MYVYIPRKISNAHFLAQLKEIHDERQENDRIRRGMLYTKSKANKKKKTSPRSSHTFLCVCVL